MRTSFFGLLAGLALAIVLVYLLIVVNFQSWLDPFIIISALPAALAGIVWMLFLTHTTISVPALTGAIMCMGVATANSILVVSFAKDELASGRAALDAALDAGFTRFRPVLMTALAMIIGMVPMALGFGEGGEQNAPLGRAVIGGPDVRDRRHAVLRAGGLRRAARPPRQGAPVGSHCMSDVLLDHRRTVRPDPLIRGLDRGAADRGRAVSRRPPWLRYGASRRAPGADRR